VKTRVIAFVYYSFMVKKVNTIKKISYKAKT